MYLHHHRPPRCARLCSAAATHPHCRSPWRTCEWSNREVSRTGMRCQHHRRWQEPLFVHAIRLDRRQGSGRLGGRVGGEPEHTPAWLGRGLCRQRIRPAVERCVIARSDDDSPMMRATVVPRTWVPQQQVRRRDNTRAACVTTPLRPTVRMARRAVASRRRTVVAVSASSATAPPPEQKPLLESYAVWCERAAIKHPNIRVAYFGDVRGVETLDGTLSTGLQRVPHTASGRSSARRWDRVRPA